MSPQFSSVAQLYPTVCDPMDCSTTNSQLLKLMSIESVMPSSHLILCHPLLLLPSVFPSIRVFSNELSLCIRWPKYWNFSFNISPSNEYSGPISFRIDCFAFLAVQGRLNFKIESSSAPQHPRPPCPSPTLRVHPNPSPLSRWWHPTISSSVVPFSSCLQSFLASGSLPMSQFFTSGGQNIGVSASASVFPVNFQDWFPLGWTGWISLQSKGLSKVFSNTTIQKYQFFSTQLSL